MAASFGCSADSSGADSQGQGGSSQAGDSSGASGTDVGTGGSGTGGISSGGGGSGVVTTTGGGNAAGMTGAGGKGGAGGSAGSGGKGGAGGGGPLPADPCIAANTCPAGTWVNVTPPDAKKLDFGTGPIVGDPMRPSDLYMGGGGEGVWKSTDYGNTWKKINDTIPYVPMGYVLTVLPGAAPPTVIVAGYKVNHKSTDGGVTYKDVPFNFPDSLYSIQIDPYDGKHLISGLHEVDGIVESTDGGDTWNYAGKGGFPSGGISWYVFFVDTGDAATTRGNWFAIAQNGGSAVMTSNAGAQWTIPTGLNGLTHAHGNAQIFQNGDTIFVPGTGGPGDGLYKSTDKGKTFTKVLGGGLSIAWGTSKNVYTMWGWACSKCDLGASFQVAPLPAGTMFTKPTVPAGLNIGANHIVVTSDGKHNIFVGTMWASGVWRYVEP
jgi:hypothetical protein